MTRVQIRNVTCGLWDQWSYSNIHLGWSSPRSCWGISFHTYSSATLNLGITENISQAYKWLEQQFISVGVHFSNWRLHLWKQIAQWVLTWTQGCFGLQGRHQIRIFLAFECVAECLLTLFHVVKPDCCKTTSCAGYSSWNRNGFLRWPILCFAQDMARNGLFCSSLLLL